MSMWIAEAVRKTTASRAEIWNRWADVAHWSVWDKDVETSSLSGNFQRGARGVLKPAGGPKSSFELIECTPLRSFTSRSYLPLCTMDFVHTMEETNDGLTISHRIVMSGFMTFLFARVIGKKLGQGLPAAVETLIAQAENR